MPDNLIYLDTYVLQQDMRIRLPKQILANLNAVNGETKFDIYLDQESKSILLKMADTVKEEKKP